MPKKLTQEQIDKKQALAEQVQQLHAEIMGFCTGRPPGELLTVATKRRLITKKQFAPLVDYPVAQMFRLAR